METPRKTIWRKARPLNANLELEFHVGCLVVKITLKNIFNLFKVVCRYNREEGKVTFSKGKLVEKIHFLKSGERGGPRGNTAKGRGFPDSLNWHAVTEERILLH